MAKSLLWKGCLNPTLNGQKPKPAVEGWLQVLSLNYCKVWKIWAPKEFLYSKFEHVFFLPNIDVQKLQTEWETVDPDQKQSGLEQHYSPNLVCLNI